MVFFIIHDFDYAAKKIYDVHSRNPICHPMTHGRKFGVTFNIRLFNFNSLFFCHFALLARKSHILSSLELCGKSKFQLCLLAMRNIVFFSSRTKRKSRARQERKFKSSKVFLRSKKRSFAVNLELRFPRPFF